MEPSEVYARQRRAWYEEPFPDIARRRRALTALRRWVRRHREDIHAALRADLGKPEPESDLSEILPVTMEVNHALRRLRRWMQPRRVGTPPPLLGARSTVVAEPKGVVLIISPWNFPLNLALVPLISALAAGNRCVVKPSELAPATSALIARIAADLFDPSEVAVVEGSAETARELLGQPFDHVFFTGSGRVGRLVMEAAAEHLSSVTLELGGKSPAIVDGTADIPRAADRIVWGKCVNAGQTCIAPDYVLVEKSRHDAFVSEAVRAVRRLCPAGTDREEGSPDYARIVTSHHADRLRGLLQAAREEGAEIIIPVDGAALGDLHIAPHLLTGVSADSALMQEEIFGPILPVLPVDGRQEALRFVRERPRPLALYMFTTDRDAVRSARTSATAGGICVNDVLLHYMNPRLPFGGTGASGMGKAHGYSGFREFSNEKPVLTQRRRMATSRLVYPPYTKAKRRRIEWMLRLFG